MSAQAYGFVLGYSRDKILRVSIPDNDQREKIQELLDTKAGLQRARRAAKVLGRPRVEVVDAAKLRALQEHGHSLRQIANKTGLSLSTVMGSLAV